MNIQLSTRQVAEITDTSDRQVDYWVRTRLLRPSGRDAKGKGSKRRYNFVDLVAIMTIARLRDRGCPLQKIRVAVRYLKAHYPDESDSKMLARLTLLTDGKRVYMITNEHDVMDVVSKQHVWSVPLGLMIAQVRERVNSLPLEWVEPVKVKGRRFHLLITHDPKDGDYVVQCRELPGALEQGRTETQAIANGKDAIESVLSFRQRQRGTRRARTG